MFQRRNYAPRSFSVDYTNNFTICCPASEFRDPANIPQEFQKVPNVDGVYRISLKSRESLDDIKSFRNALSAMTSASEAQQEFDSYMAQFNYQYLQRKF